MEDEDFWEPPALHGYGFGSTHDMRDADQPKGRLWGMRSASKAACIAYDKRPAEKARKVGFCARRPR